MYENRMTIMVTILACLYLISASVCSGSEAHGVAFPDTISVNGNTCRLIGVGDKENFAFQYLYGGDLS